MKSVRADNIELVRRSGFHFTAVKHCAPAATLNRTLASFVISKQELADFLERKFHRPENWVEGFEQTLKLPIPQLLSAETVLSAKTVQDLVPVSGRTIVSSTGDPPERARVVGITYLRHDCCEPPKGNTESFLDALQKIARAFVEEEENSQKKVYFLLPNLIAKGFPSLRQIIQTHLPLYWRCCSELFLIEDPDVLTKSWPRIDLLLAAQSALPIYKVVGAAGGAAGVGGAKTRIQFARNAWLLSEKSDPYTIQNPSDGHASLESRVVVARYATEYYDERSKIEVQVGKFF